MEYTKETLRADPNYRELSGLTQGDKNGITTWLNAQLAQTNSSEIKNKIIALADDIKREQREVARKGYAFEAGNKDDEKAYMQRIMAMMEKKNLIESAKRRQATRTTTQTNNNNTSSSKWGILKSLGLVALGGILTFGYFNRGEKTNSGTPNETDNVSAKQEEVAKTPPSSRPKNSKKTGIRNTIGAGQENITYSHANPRDYIADTLDRAKGEQDLPGFTDEVFDAKMKAKGQKRDLARADAEIISNVRLEAEEIANIAAAERRAADSKERISVDKARAESDKSYYGYQKKYYDRRADHEGSIITHAGDRVNEGVDLLRGLNKGVQEGQRLTDNIANFRVHKFK